MPTATGTTPETDEQAGVQTESQNPLLSVIGAFANDPDYDALMEDVYEYRRQLDAQEGVMFEDGSV